MNEISNKATTTVTQARSSTCLVYIFLIASALSINSFGFGPQLAYINAFL